MAALAESPRKGVPLFKTLKNVTPAAANILFTPSKDPFNEHPVLVIAVGSPGVGKTSSLKIILNNDPLLQDRGITYDHFYNVSLDTLVEHVQPYRNLTQKAYNVAKVKYNTINKATKNSLGLPNNFHNSLYGPFANLYSTVIHARTNNFGLHTATPTLDTKINKKLNELQHSAVHSAVPTLDTKINKKLNELQHPEVHSAVDPVKEEPYIVVGTEYICKYCKKSFKTTTHFDKGTYRKNKGYLNDQKGGSINTVFDSVIKLGLKKSYNMIYDTTFGPNTNKMDHIMDLLANVHVKYKIIVIHITANNDIDKATEIIQQRIRERHQTMIKKGYLRAIKLSLVRRFIEDNAVGYNAVKKAYENPDYLEEKQFSTLNKVIYEKEDFMFISVDNPNKLKSPKLSKSPTSSTRKSSNRMNAASAS
uniref:Zeta toxin domain-containing protein n=1 Tax=viral metagenome TaxID=1070528 RepID=A0A6C0IG78_9ZZZZ